ncbi:hypothetical protein BD779DRAFT_1013131 [Infundibulicybe gibba]|nr:hypothetical protein BD779DRAFT_1013131 [Infundibulicybe gibba]
MIRGSVNDTQRSSATSLPQSTPPTDLSRQIMAPFLNGEGVLVTARGPGKVHLLSYQSNGGVVAHIGAITTNRTASLDSSSRTPTRSKGLRSIGRVPARQYLDMGRASCARHWEIAGTTPR